jgi:hypothetical protein
MLVILSLVDHHKFLSAPIIVAAIEDVHECSWVLPLSRT